MTHVSFTYYEIIDKDFTGITATLRSPKRRVRYFANFKIDKEVKAIHANQTEEFCFPTYRSALAFLQSNPVFRPVRSIRVPSEV